MIAATRLQKPDSRFWEVPMLMISAGAFLMPHGAHAWRPGCPRIRRFGQFAPWMARVTSKRTEATRTMDGR